MKIISGGQTGVDRAALDVALKHGIDCGGWCPPGRLDEFGRIPDRYPMIELEQGGFTERTRRNVEESDGTIVFHAGDLKGGSKQTVEFCAKANKPCELVDASKTSVEVACERVGTFAHSRRIEILNVAGPRQTEWPGGYQYAFDVLEKFLVGVQK